MHAHDVWTLLIVDRGKIKYNLAHQQHLASEQVVTLLPPNVPHNGAPVSPDGFRKRVLYLDTSVLDAEICGVAVDRPLVVDQSLRQRISALHTVLLHIGDELEAESRIAFIAERLRQHLRGARPEESPSRQPSLAHALRNLLDENFVAGIRLQDAAVQLQASPTHLVRAFSREFGLGPHQYMIGRRVSLARRLLLTDMPTLSVSSAAGFYDQAHLSRTFKRIVGASPTQFARSAGKR